MEELSYEEVPPTDGEILSVLVDCFDVEPEVVLRWLATFNAEKALTDYRIALGTAQ